MSAARIEIDFLLPASDLLEKVPNYLYHTTDKNNCKYTEGFLPTWSLMRNLVLKCALEVEIPYFFKTPCGNGVVAGNIGCEVRHLKVLNISDARDFLWSLWVCWNFRSTTSFLTQTTGSTCVLAWLVPQILSLLWRCAMSALGIFSCTPEPQNAFCPTFVHPLFSRCLNSIQKWVISSVVAL